MNTQHITTKKLEPKLYFSSPEQNNNEDDQQSGLTTFTALLNQQASKPNKNISETAATPLLLQPALATIPAPILKAEPNPKHKKKHPQRQK